MSAPFSWINGFSRNLILSKIAETRKIADQKCSFSPSQAYEFWLAVLNSAIRAQNDSEFLKASCLRMALSDASLSLNDPDAFIRRCEQAFDSLSKRPKSNFILYATITYSGPKLFNWISDGDVRLYWQPSQHGRFMRNAILGRNSLSAQKQSLKIPADTNELTAILAYVSAPDYSDAFELANDSIDRLRGMLNLMVNSTNTIPLFGRWIPPHAINRFRRGPFHTLHKPDGSLATTQPWYEARWEHNHPTVKFADWHGGFHRKFKGWWKKLHENPMRDFKSDVLLRYCRALDIHDANASLLGMWQVLEILMGTDKYDVLIERIIRLFKDHDTARQIANHLRIRRNQSVHSTHNIEPEAHIILHQVETLASQAIFFCMRNGANFRDKTEIWEFLDLSLDHEKLRRRRQFIKYFIEYQNRG